MRVDVYAVLRRAVEDGISYGYRRAHKHTDNPDLDHVREQIENAVMGEICSWFKFGGDE